MNPSTLPRVKTNAMEALYYTYIYSKEDSRYYRRRI